MIGQLLKPINAALSFAFDVAAAIFASIGFPWLAAVCLMVLVSVVLRLFTARFIGSAIRVEIDKRNTAKAAEDARKAKNRAKDEAKQRETLRIQSGRSID